MGLTGHRLTDEEKEVGGTILHYVFGATTGLAYGIASELLPIFRSAWGLPFGAVVWIVADETVVPALGLSKHARKYSAPTIAYALAAHLVYGFVKGRKHEASASDFRQQGIASETKLSQTMVLQKVSGVYLALAIFAFARFVEDFFARVAVFFTDLVVRLTGARPFLAARFLTAFFAVFFLPADFAAAG